MKTPTHTQIHPIPEFQQICFIKNTVENPNIEIDAHIYYAHIKNSVDFERNVLYHFNFIGDKLRQKHDI